MVSGKIISASCIRRIEIRCSLGIVPSFSNLYITLHLSLPERYTISHWSFINLYTTLHASLTNLHSLAAKYWQTLQSHTLSHCRACHNKKRPSLRQIFFSIRFLFFLKNNLILIHKPQFTLRNILHILLRLRISIIRFDLLPSFQFSFFLFLQ